MKYCRKHKLPFLKRHRKCMKCIREKFILWRERNPEKAALQGIRQRAKRRGLVYALTAESLPRVPKFCPVFPWIKLRWHKHEGRQQDDSPSLDRLRNDRGYETGNVRWISWRANSLKKNASIRELSALFRDAEKVRSLHD
jgi:hypothetical protein